MPGFLVSLFFGFIPMFFFAYLVYWTDRYEKEPKKLLVGVFLWGALVAAGGAFLINSLLGLGVYLFTNSDTATELATGSLIAPVIEEILKGLAVLAIFLFFRNEFDSILDGIVYAAIAALGFAATENTYYIYTYGYLENGWGGAIFLILVRVLLVGWQHPFYTSFIGIGLSLARLNRSILVKIIAPVTGLLVAIGTHSFHNTLASMLPGWSGTAMGALFDWTGWFILFLFCLWALYREHSWLVKNLRSEVQDGIISIAQYKTACSAWAQSAARLGALFSGRYKATDRFYQVCAELAFKKEQVMTLGDESGNNALVEKLRLELAQLATKAET